MKHLLDTAMSLVQKSSSQALVLAIDDTLIEKIGDKFTYWSELYDHTAHNGSNYLNGHCLVSLLTSIPVQDGSGNRYISFPVSYRMWTKAQKKLEMAAELVKSSISSLCIQRQVILCCDS